MSLVQQYREFLSSNKDISELLAHRVERELVKPQIRIWGETSTDSTQDLMPSEMTLKKHKFRITNQYGLRIGANDVAGRTGRHSTGVDYVNDTGEAINLVPGKIIDVRRQGTGEVMSPTQGASAGYYVVVAHNDGTYSQHMHLDKSVFDHKETLLGKQLNAGDSIWTYNAEGGSGSMTAPHTKVRFFTDIKNPIASHIDPTNYIQALNL